jgi:hypothetical protein
VTSRIAQHLRSNIVGYIALFFAMTGTALALGTNTVKSKHIVDGQVKSADVQDNGLTGVDIDETSLGSVPFAAEANTANSALTAGDADTLDGMNSTDFLGATEKAANADKLDDKDSGDFALAGSENWSALGLANQSDCDFVNFGGGHNPAGYFRDRAGVVHLRGMVRARDGALGSCGESASNFTINFGQNLPPGYRPANIEMQTISANNKPGLIKAYPDGHIELVSNYPTWTDAKVWFSLDGISFRCTPSGAGGCP